MTLTREDTVEYVTPYPAPFNLGPGRYFTEEAIRREQEGLRLGEKRPYAKKHSPVADAKQAQCRAEKDRENILRARRVANPRRRGHGPYAGKHLAPRIEITCNNPTCGATFIGTKRDKTCSDECRIELHRLSVKAHYYRSKGLCGVTRETVREFVAAIGAKPLSAGQGNSTTARTGHSISNATQMMLLMGSSPRDSRDTGEDETPGVQNPGALTTAPSSTNETTQSSTAI